MTTQDANTKKIELYIYRSTFIALFAALFWVFSVVKIPLTAVPFTLQTLFTILIAFFLGFPYGFYSVIIYLALGALGLPVFSGYSAGLAVLIGPSGGYLWGMLIEVLVGGILIDLVFRLRRDKHLGISIVCIALFIALIPFAVGVPWLKGNLGLSWKEALNIGLYPFIIPDSIKVLAALIISLSLIKLRLRIRNLICLGSNYN